MTKGLTVTKQVHFKSAKRGRKVIAEGAEPKVPDLGRVPRARMTQIMSLLHLAPDIQEALLYLPRTRGGRDPGVEKMVRPIAAVPDWRKQRGMWAALSCVTGA